MSGSKSSASLCGELRLPGPALQSSGLGKPHPTSGNSFAEVAKKGSNLIPDGEQHPQQILKELKILKAEGVWVREMARDKMRSGGDHESWYWRLRSNQGAKRGEDGLFHHHAVPSADDPVLERSWVQRALATLARSRVAFPSKEPEKKSWHQALELHFTVMPLVLFSRYKSFTPKPLSFFGES